MLIDSVVLHINNISHVAKDATANFLLSSAYRFHPNASFPDPVNMKTASEKVLLSGASGMIGSAILRELSARQMPALQLSRSSVDPHRRLNPGDPSAAHPQAGSSPTLQFVAVSISGEVPWNPSTTPSVAHPELLEGLSAAIHLSGASLAAHRWTPDYKQTLVQSRVETTRSLAITLAGLRQPPPVLLVASAIGIYGNRGDELLDESSAPGSGFLADLCRQWEAAAQPAVDAGIRVVHLRFGVVLGPQTDARRGALDRLIPLFHCGLGGPLGSGRQWMGWIGLADLVSAVFFVLQTPSLSGPINFTAPNPVTNLQFTRALARQLHRPAILPAPAAALRLALGDIADEALLASSRAYPSRLAAAGFQFAHPTIDLALAAALARR
jgi:uncharacterized protein